MIGVNDKPPAERERRATRASGGSIKLAGTDGVVQTKYESGKPSTDCSRRVEEPRRRPILVVVDQ